MSIQPANKAVNHLINSRIAKEEKTAVNAYFIKNSKGDGRKKEKSHSHKHSERDWAEFSECIK